MKELNSGNKYLEEESYREHFLHKLSISTQGPEDAFATFLPLLALGEGFDIFPWV